MTKAWVIGLFLGAVMAATSASAYDAEDPANCNGTEQDEALTIQVAKVTAAPRVNFVKSPYDDDFKAETCPGATDACRKTSYLVTGDLVLAGRTRGAFTCITYQSASDRQPVFTLGWLPSAALAPVRPLAAPRVEDWIGNWQQHYAGIEITRGSGGRLRIDGIAAFKGAREVHTGALKAEVMPGKDSIAFLDDGSQPFETTSDSGCRVRMQRFEHWLVAVDNGQCGGVGVTFEGFYRRK
ncbi:MAG TPA: hypothetical protein VKY22_04980 [Bradyrhizobium sp.]|nr:hypothetical protein [Bradyrhizobium sp.]